MLPKDGLYRYLCQPDERHGDQNRRTTDFIWKKDTYKLDQIVKDPGNHALYYLHCGSDRTFVSEEIMHIPEQVSKWKYSRIILLTLLDYKKTLHSHLIKHFLHGSLS